jgi:hypothetical protein
MGLKRDLTLKFESPIYADSMNSQKSISAMPRNAIRDLSFNVFFRQRRIGFFQFHLETGKKNNPNNPVNSVQKRKNLNTLSIEGKLRRPT